jgi:predicted nucleic acid-binding protein
MAAQVLYIAREQPVKADRFFFDTSAWLRIIWAGTAYEDKYDRDAVMYGEFKSRCDHAGSTVFWSPLVLVEIGNRVEWEICKRHGAEDRRSAKSVRMDAGIRAEVREAVQGFWSMVRDAGEILRGDVDMTTSNWLDEALRTTALDGLDAVFVQHMRAAGISTVVCHDADYSSVDGLIVLTANRSLCENR